MNYDKELKKEVRLETGTRLGRATPSPAEVKNLARQILESKLRQRRTQMDPYAAEALLNAVCDDMLGWGALTPLMKDNEITEIMINGPRQIYIEKKGRKMMSDIQLDDEGHLRSLLDKMIGPSGRRLDESSPYVDFSLKDGSRVNAIISPLAADGSTITIRKFLGSLSSLNDLVGYRTITPQMGRFLEACIKAKMNMVFAGATGAGKTATLNVLSGSISDDERIITIEDALELKLNQDHVVRLLTRASNIEGKGAVTVRQLFSNSLRMRPTRIILGEIRGEEAIDYLQAMNSGHDGTLAVLHAATPTDVIGRLETMATFAGLNIPSAEIRRQIASGLHIIVQHEQLADGARKITYITEVSGMENGSVILHDIFRFVINDITDSGQIIGEFKLVDRPQNTERFRKRGIKLDEIL